VCLKEEEMLEVEGHWIEFWKAIEQGEWAKAREAEAAAIEAAHRQAREALAKMRADRARAARPSCSTCPYEDGLDCRMIATTTCDHLEGLGIEADIEEEDI